MTNVLKITLDTNCFFDYFDDRQGKEYIERIIELSNQGKIKIARTTRVMYDTFDKAEIKGRHSSIWEKIQEFSAKEISTGARMDVSRLGSDIPVGDSDFHGDYLVDDSYVELEEKLRICMPKAQIEDIDHLMGHIIDERDIFITKDKHFLDYREGINKIKNVRIMTPKEFIEYLVSDKL